MRRSVWRSGRSRNASPDFKFTSGIIVLSRFPFRSRYAPSPRSHRLLRPVPQLPLRPRQHMPGRQLQEHRRRRPVVILRPPVRPPLQQMMHPKRHQQMPVVHIVHRKHRPARPQDLLGDRQKSKTRERHSHRRIRPTTRRKRPTPAPHNQQRQSAHPRPCPSRRETAPQRQRSKTRNWTGARHPLTNIDVHGPRIGFTSQNSRPKSALSL